VSFPRKAGTHDDGLWNVGLWPHESKQSANPPHEHEWMVRKDVKLTEGKILIPGIVTHCAPRTVETREMKRSPVIGDLMSTCSSL
jgi:hypothetical protein